MKNLYLLLLAFFWLMACQSGNQSQTKKTPADTSVFTVRQQDDQITIHLKDSDQTVVTQNARADHRPYLHPILAPDTKVELTQYSPGHHKHQTGVYWGFTRVNGSGATDEELKKWFYNRDKPEDIKKKIGRDYFHFPGATHWKKVSANVLITDGEKVRWQTVYHMLDADGSALLEETQVWSLSEQNNKYLLELEWKGKALEADVTINKFDYGGLFVRMPWSKETEGEAVTEARHRNEKAEGQRSIWTDIGMEITGLDGWGHIAILDHPDNPGFPNHWRVDGQLGVGPIHARKEDWTIPQGETVTFRHQLVAYEGQYSDVEMKQIWSDFVGDHGMYNSAVMWNIARAEGYNAAFLNPQEAVEAMTIKPGYKVNTYASEPMMTQPMAFCWDDRGRMWIAENRDYENRQEGFSNDGNSRILILEDTDQDGVADKKTVFLEDIPFPSAIAVGFDGLYLGAVPNLLFVPDRDGDDKADVDDIEILLTGWGIRDRHETINSLHWGPDGWLYGCEGFATPSRIRKPKGKGRIYRHKDPFPDVLAEKDGVDINGGVWRYHPTKDRFEVVAHGFSNPWGIDYDAKGQTFITACVIPHLFHIIPGGIYQRQGGQHFNPYVYKDLQTIVDHRHRSAHGGARVYLSDAFPADQHGRLFMANIHEHAVLSDVLTPKGSGYVASHGEDFLMANNAQWIGFSMELGPEGGLYVLDWHDEDICGNDVTQKETGRIFRIMPEQSQAENFEGRYADLNQQTDTQLAKLQTVKSSWHARRARVVLQKRAHQRDLDATAVAELNNILTNNANADYRLRALWSLHVAQQLSETQMIDLLDDSDAYIRGWTVQLMTEDNNASTKALEKMARLSANDKSPVVRMYLAAALQRMPHADRWALAEGLVQHAVDATDHNIPLMLWFGVEPIVAEQADRALALAAKSKIPLIANHIARRLTDADQPSVVMAALQQSSERRKDLLEGLLAGMEGRTDLKEPAVWPSVYDQLKKDKDLAALATRVAQQFGSATAAREMLATLRDKNAGPQDRKLALSRMAAQQRPELESVLPELIDQPALRVEAIQAIAAFDNIKLGALLLDKYPTLNLQEKQAAIQTFASRSDYGWILAKALKDGEIEKKDVPAYVALQLRRVVGNGFVEIWGPIDDLSSDKQAAFAKYQRLLNDRALAAADPHNGRMVYQRTCWSCHKMYDDGGVIGPALTGSNRGNLSYLLSNILDPSGEIQDDYKMVVITTQDGRTYSGNVIGESDRQLTMRIVGQDELVINKSEVRSREQTPKSMMPEGLLNTLTDDEVIDLVAYLQTAEQVEMGTEPGDD
ncbi:MAG: PVC-type heme-binding CxxCH protein [Bacteroidota bacterium]